MADDYLPLLRAYQDVMAALRIFKAGGRITHMMAAVDLPTDIDPAVATVDTREMQYPDQMVQTIVQFLETKRTQLVHDLGQLGITGFDQTQRTARRR